MSDLPISVLLPFRNAQGTLPAALRSLRAQSHEDFEVVGVDDGSTDGGAAAFDAIAAGDPRFRLLRQPALGLVPALNLGLRACRGGHIARMDADDISLRDRLRHQLAFLNARPELAVASCLVRIVPAARLTGGMRRYEAWLNSLTEPRQIRADLLVESPLCHPSVMIRAEAVRAAGGYRDGDFPEDHDLWLRLDAAGARMGKVDRLLFLWRDSPDRLTRSAPRYSPDAFRRLKLHHVLARRGQRRLLLWGAGVEGKLWLRHLRPLDVLEDRVVDISPRRLGQRIHGCLVIPPEELGPPSHRRWVVVAVSAPGARAIIRARLAAAGYQEPEHFVCVA